MVSLLKNLSSAFGSGKFDLASIQLPTLQKIVPWFVTFLSGFMVSSIVGFGIAYWAMPPVNTSAPKLPEGFELRGGFTLLPKATADEFRNITTRNVFNSEAVNETSKETDANRCQPQKSDLPLKFTGVIFGGTASTSLVLLESTANRLADSFLLGDTVPGDAKIVDIKRDKVFFVRNGCPEFLEIQEPELPKRRVAGERKKLAKANAGAGGLDTNFKEDGFERAGGNTNVTKQWVEKALTVDFAKTLQDAKASPNTVNGEVKGFVLTRIRPDSVYEKMGFQDGDVVEGINGIELNDAARAIQTLNAMRNENNIDVQIKRNGTSMQFKLQVK